MMTVNESSHPYHARRRQHSAPRWALAAALRAQGCTYAAIGARLGVSLTMAFKLILKHETKQNE